MAQNLIAALLVVIAERTSPDLARWRDFAWLRVWLAHASPETGSRFPPVLVPLLVVVLCALIQLALDNLLFGLPVLAFGVIVLFYCWGPRDLEADIEAVLKAPDSERRHAAAQALRAESNPIAPLPLESAALVEAAFAAALSRWFGVLFWFVILGPAGALGYRVVQLLARSPAFASAIDASQRSLLERCALILDWAPAHLVALTLALVADFDAVMTTWRNYHAAHGNGYFTLDLGFLPVLAKAGIDADVIAGDGYASDVSNPLIELGDARDVLRRVLIAWLALIAVLALASVMR